MNIALTIPKNQFEEMLEVLQSRRFLARSVGVLIASLLRPSRDVAEVLRTSHRVSGLVDAVVGARSHLPFEMCPRDRIKPKNVFWKSCS
jgi:hypothetical protein